MLLADDEAYILSGLSRLIDWESLGYSICGMCVKSSAAMETALSTRPDLVIVDIEMPGMSGLTLMEKLRPRLPETRFVILSAYDLFEYARRAMELGACHYLLKPIDAEKLTELLLELSEQLERQNREKERQRRITEQVLRQDRLLSDYVIKEAFLGKTAEWDGELERLYDSIKDGYSYQLALFWFWKSPNMESESVRRLQKQAGRLSFCYEDLLVLVEEELPPERLREYGELACEPAFIGCTPKRTGLSDARRFLSRACGELRQQACFEEPGKPILCGGEPSGDAAGSGVLFALREKRGARLTSCVMTLDADAARSELREIGAILRETCRSVPAEQLRELFRSLFTDVWKNVRMMLEPGTEEGGALPSPLDFSRLVRLSELLTEGERQAECMVERLRQSTGSREIVAEIKSYVKSHFQERDLKLSAIADKYYINYSYLSYIFKKKTGVNFYSYLLDIRLTEAKRLLRATTLPVTDIAALVGYPDSKNFHHLFKKHVGLSPNKYRGLPVGEAVL